MAKHCSDSTLVHIDNQHPFLQHHAATFVPVSVGETDQLGCLLLQIHIEKHSSVNICLVFYLMVYGILSLLGRRCMDLKCPHCF